MAGDGCAGGKRDFCTFSVHVDVSELDEAIRKAEHLRQLMEEVCVRLDAVSRWFGNDGGTDEGKEA